MAEYIISSGELESGIILENDSMTVLDGGVATDTTVNSGGSMNISSGGTATGIMENGGFVYVEDGADVSFIPNTISELIISQGSATVHSGTTATGIAVNSRGSMYVFSGGTALEIMENGGYVEVVDGADVSFKSNTISWMVCEAPATIHSGTTANSTTISGGCLYISSGGTANNTLNRGSMVVFSGGIADCTTVNAGGNMFISSGGIAFNTIVNNYYERLNIHVLSGGTADSVLVDSNCGLCVVSGGKLTGRITCLGNAETLECGIVALDDGAIVDFDLTHSLPEAAARINNLSCFGGVTTRWPRDIVYTLTVNAVQTEGVYTLADHAGMFNQTITVINGAGEELGTISLGETVIISGVSYTLDLSDNVLSLKIGENITPSPYTSDGLILSNYANVKNNEFYHDTLIIAGGRLEISSGGIANIIMIGSRGKVEVNTNGIANNTEISSNGHMDVFSGGSVSNTAVHFGGRFTVSSGGTANRTIINSGVSFVVGNGVKAFEIVENGGYVDVKAGADVTFASNTFSGLFFSRASATVHSGTTAVNTILFNNCRFHIFSGGIADSTSVVQGGSMFVYSGGVANNTEIDDRSRLIVSSWGTANNTIVNSNAGFIIDGIANDTTVNSGGGMGVVGMANSIAVSCGEVDIYSGGMANHTIILGDSQRRAVVEVSHSGIANNTSVNQYGSMLVSSGGTANFTTVNSGGEITIKLQGIANVTTIGSGGGVSVVESGGIVNSANVCSGGSLSVYANAKLTGQMTFAEGAIVSARQRAILDFDISGLTPEAGARVNNLAFIQGMPVYTLTVDADSWKAGSYTYSLAKGAENFASTITVVDKMSGDELGVLTLGETVRIGYNDYTLNLNEGALSVTIAVADMTPGNPAGTADGLSWDGTGANAYVVELSTGEPGNALTWTTSSTAQDLYDLPGGTYQWHVKADANSDWAVGEAIVSENAPGAAKVLQSDGDDCDDLFFANPTDTWSRLYYAQHVGSLDEDGWTGTKEIVSANGKGRIQNLFFGSYDPNVLCLTDGENGDAIFLDDMYTELPDEIEANTARLLEIHEIRAGAGDDIVDMTSQQFAYLGEGQTIHGGDGNDVIWANTGANRLFGDAGNDRIVGASGADVIAGGIGDDRLHGGGGDDTFTFCDNWGKDTVQQLETGSVTLWFASGDESNWDASTMTYTDGENSVTVVGVTAEQVTLKFGDDGSARFASLANMGAFDDATSRKIFESVLA